MTMIPSIVRFNHANYNLANRQLTETSKGLFGIRKVAVYKFNNYGRIASMSSFTWDDEENAVMDTHTIDFIRDNETDKLVGFIFSAPHAKDHTVIELDFDELALSGYLRVFTNSSFNEYSIFNNESETLLTDGYEDHHILYDLYGRPSTVKSMGETTSFTYDDFGRLIRTSLKTHFNGDSPTTVYYFYDDNNLPVKTITLNNGGMYETSYILS